MTCPHCKGNGRYTSPLAHGFRCDVCRGTGKVTENAAKEYSDRVAREIKDFLND